MMGEEEPKTTIQRIIGELRKQQKEVTWKNVYEKLWGPDIFPEDGEIHINIKKHNIKFNFKN